jgi:hypothetical protein
LSERKLQQMFNYGFHPRQRASRVRPVFSTPSSTEVAMRIFERLRDRNRSGSSFERKLFEAIAGDLLRRIEQGTEAGPAGEQIHVLFLLLGRRDAASVTAPDQCGPCIRRHKKPPCAIPPRAMVGFRSRLPPIIVASNSAKSAWSASRRCAFRAGANRACGTTSGRTRRCSFILLTGEAGGRRCSLRRDLAGFEFVE